MATPAKGLPAGLDLSALDALTDAVESGAGLPEVVRAASRALDASLVCLDRAGAVLAVAVRSPADERALLDAVSGVESLDLRVGDVPVGALRLRSRGDADEPAAGPALLRLVATLVASEVERLRAPARASEQAAAAFLSALLERRLVGPRRARRRGRGDRRRPARRRDACSSPARTPTWPPTTRWRPRVLAAVLRGARAVLPAGGRGAARGRRPAGGRGRRAPARAPRTPPPRAPRPRCSSSSRAPSRAARSRSGAAASPRIRPTCTGRRPRRCWPPTSPRATRSARSWPSRRRAPTGCCCRP